MTEASQYIHCTNVTLSEGIRRIKEQIHEFNGKTCKIK